MSDGNRVLPVGTPGMRCPECDVLIGEVELDGENIPKDGDAAVCNECGAVLVLSTKEGVRVPNQEELRRIMEQHGDNIRSLQAAVWESWRSDLSA